VRFEEDVYLASEEIAQDRHLAMYLCLTLNLEVTSTVYIMYTTLGRTALGINLPTS